MSLQDRLGSKFLRDQHALMSTFEYELVRFERHPIYEREGFDTMVLSSSPRNERRARQRLLVELRQRHPEHDMWRSMQKRRRRPPLGRKDRKRKERARMVADLRAAERRHRQQAPPPVLVRPDRTSCIDCGRLWRSDLNPVGRSCPDCGGPVVLGKEAA